MAERAVNVVDMNARLADRLVLNPTLADWNRFCRDKGIGEMKPCPLCGADGQVGADEAQASAPMGPPMSQELLRTQTMTQECDNCGYQMTYSMRPFVDWLSSR